MNPLSHYDPADPYPETDGKPMVESTEQYEWLVKIKENLECLFAEDPEVFVAGDLFWYPVRGLDHNSAHLVQSRRRRFLSEHGLARANPHGPAGLGRICDQGCLTPRPSKS